MPIVNDNQKPEQTEGKPDACIKIERFGSQIKVTIDGVEKDLVFILKYALEHNPGLEHILNHCAELKFKELLRVVKSENGIPIKQEQSQPLGEIKNKNKPKRAD